ncbi:MAG: hypothetical protein HZB68_03790 [Candidatus Aenigmarchaeota archaeon]|nr:hypothetical protein [Candidatus Aenigmarchaeota archaeon]
MELGDRINKFVANRKISFDGECYHSRIPLKIIKFLQQYCVELNGVQWEGVWKDGKCFHIVLTFGEKLSSKETSKTITTEEDDYIILKE